MTEEEWLEMKAPSEMLKRLQNRVSSRKMRYFVVACTRRVLPESPDTGLLNALEVAESYADGNGTANTLERTRRSLKDGHAERVLKYTPLFSNHIRSVPAWYALIKGIEGVAERAAHSCAWASTRSVSSGTVVMGYPEAEIGHQVQLIRDIFGNPFRPVAFDAAWRTSTTVGVAQKMYDAREFHAMPILADALQDAGCENDAILSHCRDDGPHVRGCWVVDLVLGKQ